MATVLQRDITDALRRLRDARNEGDPEQEEVCEGRLNRLLDQVRFRRKTD